MSDILVINKGIRNHNTTKKFAKQIKRRRTGTLMKSADL